ncbi:NAD(P)/FAD-dependent oxidoreductase [Nocardioides dongxiaopingii]|uniref:flavin-containing monooxygenase n=1 Tax=Nocardioides sp. S-1144 TaxID=2582905 RepID=UPI0011641064|nr:NAD(P)/FAD-dependent oxidoreductase [Nocardioides sp. S-1144]QDH11206.1 NAD(P)/FAD-dependent oxidoreductase [Nocardioides sp. S-1144]
MSTPASSSSTAGTEVEHVDVLVVGAGLSGIGAACQVRAGHPGRTVAVLESRDVSGGTWDLFRYPGVRSDSDMFTFGYRWRPWPSDTALADGALILDYLRTVAQERGVDKLIRYRYRVTSAAWSSETARWTVGIEHDGAELTMTCDFLWGCTGYYDYEEGHRPAFPGEESFTGQVVHPQFWPEDLDHAGKDVVVIGSGATAVTLVPSMAETAAHVTMLQRTPTYILPQPDRDPLAVALRRVPEKVRYPIVRWANVLKLVGNYQLSQRFPDQAKKLVRRFTEPQLPEGTSYDEHFQPPYNPWDQRLCVVPNSDLFKALRAGTASVVTDTIETFTPTGIRTTSGRELDADVVVTATGLKLKLFGGIDVTVDGVPFVPSETMSYKGLMLSGVPNFAFTVGYTNASWTLKADLVGEYVVRLLAHMDRHGLRTVVAVRDDSVGERPFMDLASGYVQRALAGLPRQGDRAPWMLKQNYLVDLRAIRRGAIDDGVLSFG